MLRTEQIRSRQERSRGSRPLNRTHGRARQYVKFRERQRKATQTQLGDQLESDLPQPLRIVWIDRIGSNTATEICRTLGDPWGLVAVLEIEAADAVEQRRGGESTDVAAPCSGVLRRSTGVF